MHVERNNRMNDAIVRHNNNQICTCPWIGRTEDKKSKVVPDSNDRLRSATFSRRETKIDIYEPNKYDDHNNCRSLGEYIHNLAAVSIFPGVSQIVQVSSHWRKIFKILVLIGCVIGFGYQSYISMHQYYTYPTTIEIQRKYSNNLPIPKLTFCNRNGFQRIPFCQDYPNYCYIPPNKTEFCSEVPNYCRGFSEEENITVLWSDRLSMNNSLLRKYSQHADELFEVLCYSHFPIVDNKSTIISESLVPHSASAGQERICYSVDYSKIDVLTLEEKPSMDSLRDIVQCFWWTGQRVRQKLLTTILNIQSNQYSRPELVPSIQVAVSSPHASVNPFIKGFQALPGKKYMVKVIVIEHILLPQPFFTNCTKTEELSKDYSKEICIMQCHSKEIVQKCHCAPSAEYETKTINKCQSLNKILCLLKVDYSDCYSSCADPCNYFTFDYNVEEMDLANTLKPAFDIEENAFDDETFLIRLGMNISKAISINDRTIVSVMFESKEIQVLKYKAMFEKNAVLGIIGGYSGLWLGMSLITILNVVEDVILVLHRICFKD